jgi:hypothetical protein
MHSTVKNLITIYSLSCASLRTGQSQKLLFQVAFKEKELKTPVFNQKT